MLPFLQHCRRPLLSLENRWNRSHPFHLKESIKFHHVNVKWRRLAAGSLGGNRTNERTNKLPRHAHNMVDILSPEHGVPCGRFPDLSSIMALPPWFFTVRTRILNPVLVRITQHGPRSFQSRFFGFPRFYPEDVQSNTKREIEGDCQCVCVCVRKSVLFYVPFLHAFLPTIPCRAGWAVMGGWEAQIKLLYHLNILWIYILDLCICLISVPACRLSSFSLFFWAGIRLQ